MTAATFMNSRRLVRRSTFASGLDGPTGLAFNGAGDLFVADRVGDNITEITPGGAKSTFASGWIILRWPSKAKPCLCLNPRLWDCWPLAFPRCLPVPAAQGEIEASNKLVSLNAKPTQAASPNP